MPAYKGEHEDIVVPFVDAMRFKLAANKHKGKRFEDMSFDDMFEKLQAEVEELREAIAGGNQFEIIFEGADIANFACFIASKAIREAGRGERVVNVRADDYSTTDNPDPDENNYQEQGTWQPGACAEDGRIQMWKHKSYGYVVYECHQITLVRSGLPIAPWTRP